MTALAVALSDHEQDEFDEEAPASISTKLAGPAIDDEDRDWLEWLCMSHLNMNREGATFLRLADNVFVIGVYGGQFVHHDRHLEYLQQTEGFSDHTWNVVAVPSEGQMLLTEDDDRIFRHHRLDELDTMIYMNTRHHHLVSRETGDEVVVLVQADGFGPNQRDEALQAIRTACAARQFKGTVA